MTQEYLTRALFDLQRDGAEMFPLGTEFEMLDTRKLTLRVKMFEIFAAERLSAHLGLTTEQFVTAILAAALNDAIGYFSGSVDSDFFEDADDYLDAWRTYRASQDCLTAMQAGWRALCLENKAAKYLDQDATPKPVHLSVDKQEEPDQAD